MPKAIFIHVPKTGGTSLLRHAKDLRPAPFHYAGHTSAIGMRHKDPKMFDRSWVFAFVRNPWDHAASWFYFSAMRAGREKEILYANEDQLRRMFSLWLKASGHQMLGRFDRCFHTILCDHEDKLIVDTVYRFEDYDASWAKIHARLKLPPTAVRHDNENLVKPKLPYTELYEDWSRNFIAGLQWWVIDKYGYKFGE